MNNRELIKLFMELARQHVVAACLRQDYGWSFERGIAAAYHSAAMHIAGGEDFETFERFEARVSPLLQGVRQ